MANKILQRTPLVVVGDLLPEVKFNVELYMAEENLTTPVTLTPLAVAGSQEALKPLIGAKVIYKFTNTGPGGTLTIGPGFSIDPQSVLFDPAPFAVNIVTMFYDGSEFWACLSTANPVPIPLPAGGAITRIGDFGWGPGLIVVNTSSVEISLIDLLGTPTGQISAFDAIASIHYTGTDDLIFTVDDMFNPGTPSTNADPKLAVRQYGCADLGMQFASITVSEATGPLTSIPTAVVVTVDDNGPICNP